MSSSNPTYSTFIQASKNLRKATKITTRRKAASDLLNLLTDVTLRHKLKKEAVNIATKSLSSSSSSSKENATTANRVLRKVYRTLMDDVMHSTYQSINSKVKLKLEDIILPRRVLLAIDSESDQTIASLKKDKKGWFYITEPFTFEAFDRYRNTNATLTYLSNTDIMSLLNYSLGCLRRKEICDVAQTDLLNLLYKLCSRSDYVSTFGTSNDVILEIIQELQPRIIPNTESSVASLAAKIFESLIHILTVELGIDMQIFVRPCLCLIVDWVRHVTNANGSASHNKRGKFDSYGTNNKSGTLVSPMYGTAVNLLAAHPELCSGIFTNDEDLAKDLLDYAFQCWNMTRSIERDVIVGYFSAHL